MERLKRLEEFSLSDLEAIRLILRGESVIDWQRLNFASEDEVKRFLQAEEFSLDVPSDRARLEAIREEAMNYLRRHFEYPIPKPIARATVPELMMIAAGKGHRQMCACTILKCMHIIHHLDGRELLFVLPMSHQELFHLVEEKAYRVIGGMLAAGFPIAEFVGGRKSKDSLYTKLLAKQETTAAQIYDKLRFRIVTKKQSDIFPVLEYLTKNLFPFNYVVPKESINSLVHFRSQCQKNAHLRQLLPYVQGRPDDDLTPTDNKFSAETYKVLHFVVDMPVRLPEKTLRKAASAVERYGSVIFVICEFQLVDQQTEAQNEVGEASHARYKDRQRKAVMRRLHLGSQSPVQAPRPLLTERRKTVAPPAPAGERRRRSILPEGR